MFVVTFLFALRLVYLRCDFFICVAPFLFALRFLYLRCDFFICVETFICVATFLFALRLLFALRPLYLRCDFFIYVATFYLRCDSVNDVFCDGFQANVRVSTSSCKDIVYHTQLLTTIHSTNPKG